MFIHLDADEYMYLKNHTNIVEYINYINGWGKQIVFYWLLVIIFESKIIEKIFTRRREAVGQNNF
jgi:hypothetical protein